MCVLKKFKSLYHEVRAEIRDILYIISLEMNFDFDLSEDDLEELETQT